MMDVEAALRDLETLVVREREAWDELQVALLALDGQGDEATLAPVQEARARWADATRARHAIAVALSRHLLDVADDNRRRQRKTRL